MSREQVVCQNCQRQPATVIRRVRTKGKAMQDRHECAACAEKRNIQRYGSKKRRGS
jgi:protein-arginine kinase activator protein McsA